MGESGTRCPQAGPTDVLRDPRRSPRVQLGGHASLQVRGEVRRAVLKDIGPGGCLLLADEALIRGVAVRLSLMGDGIPEPLAGTGRVAWVREALTGVEFAPEAILAAAAWFQRVPGSRGQLQAPRPPRELPGDTPLFAPPSPSPARLAPDELSLLRVVTPGIAASMLVRQSGFAEARAARALFGLLEKRALSLVPCVPNPARPMPAGPPRVGRAPAAREVPVAAARRPAAAQALLDAALDAAQRGQVSAAIPLARRALQESPHDSEIAKVLSSLAFGPKERWSAVTPGPSGRPRREAGTTPGSAS